jgi:4-amino-4-deoxy-L-arabinose transferase-like glycosyltransferase
VVPSRAVKDRQQFERMLRVVIAIASLGMLAIVLFPPYFATPDEAKYIGLGLNILDGRGLITVFGVSFPNHSPIWPLALALPQRLFGIDALAVGHVLNAIAAAAVVALTGVMGWRVRPAAGALAAVVMFAFPFLASNARTAGIDLPATALTLAFFVAALRALDRGSTPLALAAGVLFGLGFLVKETALPFFPVPFLVALVGGVDVRRMARLGAAAVATSAITVSWWFVMHAGMQGTVYRLGTPAWTLAPITVGLVIVVIAGWNSGWIATRTATWRSTIGVSEKLAATWRPIVAWGGLAAWSLGQLFVYSRTAKLAGQSLFRVSQWASDIHVYLPHVALLAGFSIGGGLLALALVRRSQGVRELVFATVAGVPLILLVLAIGEAPRHYLANLAVLAALASAGWLHGLDRARVDRRWAVVLGALVVVGVVVALRTPGTPVRVGIVVAVVLALGAAWLTSRDATRTVVAGLVTLLAAGSIVFATGATAKPLDTERAKEQAVGEVSAWINATVPAGDTVVLSPLFAYEIALEIRDGHPPLRIRPAVAVVDAQAPMGLRYYGKRPVEVPLAIDTALRNVDQLDVYAAELLDPLMAEHRPTTWIDAAFLSPGEGPTSTTAMLDAATGIEVAEQWRYPLDGQELVVTAWSIDPDTVAFDGTTTFADAPTIEALIRLIEADGGGASAAVLADRIVLSPPDPRGDALLGELRGLATGAPAASPTPSGSASPTTP